MVKSKAIPKKMAHSKTFSYHYNFMESCEYFCESFIRSFYKRSKIRINQSHNCFLLELHNGINSFQLKFKSIDECVSYMRKYDLY